MKSVSSSSIKLSNYNTKTIRCYKGIEFSLFNERIITKFLKGAHKVSVDSNRMGIVLLPEEPMIHNKSIISSPVLPGTLQLPPNGNVIVLGKDGQSIGGYPRIGTIIREDLAILAQKRPEEIIYFDLVEW
jgi:allophanate hydrolase subunit 2